MDFYPSNKLILLLFPTQKHRKVFFAIFHISDKNIVRITQQTTITLRL